MASYDKQQRSEWVGPLLIVVGAIVLAGGLGIVYMGGICGFQADPAEAAACLRRWRTGGALVFTVGAVMVLWGARRARRARAPSSR